jgi:hypothetical protein
VDRAWKANASVGLRKTVEKKPVMIMGVLADTQGRHLETQANLLSHIYNNKLQTTVINETESLAQLLSLIKWMN